jgi:hypothetical protein
MWIEHGYGYVTPVDGVHHARDILRKDYPGVYFDDDGWEPTHLDGFEKISVWGSWGDYYDRYYNQDYYDGGLPVKPVAVIMRETRKEQYHG